MHRRKLHLYSITSVAVANSVGGTVRPSVLALFMFMIRMTPASAAGVFLWAV